MTSSTLPEVVTHSDLEVVPNHEPQEIKPVTIDYPPVVEEHDDHLSIIGTPAAAYDMHLRRPVHQGYDNQEGHRSLSTIQGKDENPRRRTTCGIDQTTFFLLLALIVVILAAAIGGGVGGT
jgi:hypothetical protein